MSYKTEAIDSLNLRFTYIFFLLLSLQLIHLQAQEDFTQNVRGKVIDMNSGFGLPNANVILLNSQQKTGAETNAVPRVPLPVNLISNPFSVVSPKWKPT